MGLYKRGSVWWMSFIYQGKQHRKSTETDDPQLAKRIYDKVRGEVAERKWFPKLPGEDLTFKQMMAKYMTEHSEPTKASAERDKSSLTHLLPFFGDRGITEITARDVNEYKTNRRTEGASPCTINRELALMKHAYNLAVKEWELIDSNPVQKISMEKEPPSRDRWLTYTEEDKLLASSPFWLREILIFAIETGCRREEILSLEWRDFDLHERTVTIFGRKTGERRTIPLTGRAFDVLSQREERKKKVRSLVQNLVFTYPEGQKVNINTLRGAFEAALKRAKIEGFRFHDLRHYSEFRIIPSDIVNRSSRSCHPK